MSGLQSSIRTRTPQAVVNMTMNEKFMAMLTSKSIQENKYLSGITYVSHLDELQLITLFLQIDGRDPFSSIPPLGVRIAHIFQVLDNICLLEL